MTTLLLAAVLQTQAATSTDADYAGALRQSISSGRPLVVLLGAEWCPGCVQMKNSTMPRVAKAGGLRNVAYAYVDFDRQPKLAARLAGGSAIPQLIRYEKTEKGWKKELLVGAQSPKRVTSFVDRQPPRDDRTIQASALMPSRARAAAAQN